MDTPKYRFQNLIGMSQDGMFYLEGFDVGKYNGKFVLEPTISLDSPRYTTSTSGFSNFQKIQGMIDITGRIGGGTNDSIIGIGDGRIYCFSTSSSSSVGEIHKILDLGGNRSSDGIQDVIITAKGNLLYSHVTVGRTPYVGIGYIGEATSSSSSTKIVDRSGRDWSTLGISTSDNRRNKVVNLYTGQQYTVTSITTTTSTNDTLNFSEVTGKTNSENDTFIVFYDDKFDLSSGATYPHFRNQIPVGRWSLQFFSSGIGSQASVFVTNGNYLSNIAFDDATISVTAKQLPVRCQALCHSLNGANLLISGEKDGDGMLLLTTPTDTEFSSMITIDNPIPSLDTYKQGWIYVQKGVVYQTDGYQVYSVGEYPEKTSSIAKGIQPRYFCQTFVLNNELYIVNSYQNYNRNHAGLYIFNIDRKDWRFVRIGMDSYGYAESIYPFTTFDQFNNPTINIIASKYPGIYLTSGKNQSKHQSAVLYGALSRKERINRVRVNLTQPMYGYEQTSGNDRKMNLSVFVSDGRKQLYRFGQATIDAGKTTAVANNNLYRVSGVVEEGNIVNSYQNNIGWSVIQTITDPGTTTETWTVSPAFTSAPSGSTDVQIIGAKYCGTIEVDCDKLDGDYFFDVTGFEGDKIYVGIFIDSLSGKGAYPICVNSIELY